MTKTMFVRSAAHVRAAVIGLVPVSAAAVISGVCAAVMSNGGPGDLGNLEIVVALALCAAVGAGTVVVASGIVNLVEGVGFTWPRALTLTEVGIPLIVNLFVGIAAGAVCGAAFFERILADDLHSNAYIGALFGFACACTMDMGGLTAWNRLNR
ncbi:hypothetical protein GWI34_26900 [Actinomadura sp. DSM 109109]|nr:hypothetical protein [Actinomadura lepetitiana]